MTCKGQTAWELENCSDQQEQVQALLGVGVSIEFTVGAEGVGDVVNVAGQVVDANGDPVTQPYGFYMWLSDAAGGALAAAGPSGGGAIGTDGIILEEFTADKSYQVLSDATGAFDIDFTEAGALTLYLNALLPDGTIVSSTVLTWAA